MKSYYNKDTNCIVQVCFGNEVTLPNNSDEVEVIHYAKNNLMCSKKKTCYSDKLKKCNDVKALIDELTRTSEKKNHCNNSDNQNRNKKKRCDNSEKTIAKKVREKGNKKAVTIRIILRNSSKTVSKKTERSLTWKPAK